MLRKRLLIYTQVFIRGCMAFDRAISSINKILDRILKFHTRRGFMSMDPMVMTKFMFPMPRGFRNIRTKGFYGCRLDHVGLDDLLGDRFNHFTQSDIFSSSVSFQLTFRDNHVSLGSSIVVRW